jgi:hypothetical protein
MRAEVGHHRLARDVVPEARVSGERDWSKALGGQHLAEIDDLAVLVGNLDADHALAGNHLDDAHADHRQGARQILGQVRDARHLHPAAGWISKRVITGPG